MSLRYAPIERMMLLTTILRYARRQERIRDACYARRQFC